MEVPIVLPVQCGDGTVPCCGDAEWVCVLSPRSMINFSAVDIFRACPRSHLILSLPVESKVACEIQV